MSAPKLSADLLAVEDDLEVINALYHARGWTDGLPIIPPTPERVRRMLAWTDRDPESVLLAVPPRRGEATVETVAIAAVMAGAPPEAMPLLITAVEALGDPAFNLFGVMATTYPSGVLMIANGPLAEECGMHGGSGSREEALAKSSQVPRSPPQPPPLFPLPWAREIALPCVRVMSHTLGTSELLC